MNETNFEVYERLLGEFLLNMDLQDRCIKSSENWAALCQKHPNDSAVKKCFNDSLDRMKLSIENCQTARENLDKFVRENLR